MIECNKNNNSLWHTVANLPENPYILHTNISKFKCLFVHFIHQNSFLGCDYPVAFGYMASLLRMNGASATITIEDIKNYELGIFSGYDLICFYPMAAILHEMLEQTVKIKNEHPYSQICLFNSEQHQHEMLLCSPRAVDFAQIIMEQYSSIDFTLVGEAEYSFIKLCEKLVTGKRDFENLPLCFYRKSDQVRASTLPIEPVNFKYLPFPSRDFLEKSISTDNVNIASPRIQSSRGCVSRCLYCVESHTNITHNGRKKAWLGRDIVAFVDEIEILSKYYKAFFFNIIDSSFEDPGLAGIERMKRFCDEIIKRRIQASFKIHLRVETINKLSDEFLLNLKDAGVDVVVCGIESGIDRELEFYCYKTNAEQNLRAILKIDSFDKFFTPLGHMMFSPFLKLEDLRKKVEFLKAIHHGWDYLNISNNLLIFRGTVLHDYIEERGLCLKYDRLSGIIPYDYEDERVQYVANEIGGIKTTCPEIISLNNLLYDALNIKSRFYNKANRHLWEKEVFFIQYRERLNKFIQKIENVLTEYFFCVINLVESGWSKKRSEEIYNQWIPEYIPRFVEAVRQIINDLITSYEQLGFSTSKLYLKTWLSLINQKNTTGGKV